MSGHFDTTLLPVNLSAELGYLMVLQGVQDATTKVNPGDILYANLMVGYSVQRFEPRLSLLFAQEGETQVTTTFLAETTTTRNNSDKRWLAVALALWYHFNPALSAHIGWGSAMDARGLNLPEGYIISGKNVEGGPLLFNAAVTAHF